MAKIKLTKTPVEAAQPQAKDMELRDTVVPGFLCKMFNLDVQPGRSVGLPPGRHESAPGGLPLCSAITQRPDQAPDLWRALWRLGQQIAATARGGGVSWEIGRQRGPSVG